jgi:hypothetical protein
MSISEGEYGLLAPVTRGATRAFVRVRPIPDDPFITMAAIAGDAVGETVTSEGRCPR